MVIVNYYKTFIFEIKKISWISIKKALALSFMVFLVMIVGMLLFLMIDSLILGFLSLIFRFA